MDSLSIGQKTTFVVVAVAGALAAATAYFIRKRKDKNVPKKEEEVKAGITLFLALT